MKSILLVLILQVTTNYFVHAQNPQFVYLYDYEDYEARTNNPVWDSEAMSKSATKILTSKVQLEGVTYTNGTRLRLYVNDSKLHDTIRVGNTVSVNLHSENNSGDLTTFYNNKDVIKIQMGDTMCFYNDTSYLFVKTNERSTIGRWNCEAYKSILPTYSHVIIWSTNEIPRQVCPGYLNGVEGGVVQIDNITKKIKIKLINYKKMEHQNTFLINCTQSIRQPFTFIDAYR
ncbi:MAG: hypothetical protein KF744_16145 [Taibaiella sp.]|nr:hypothetical protein [Taibaiella sp.]